jgi:hypothetical protein
LPIALPRLAAMIALSLVGAVPGPAGETDLPAIAEVVAGSLDVFDEPEPTAFAPGRLRRGDRVMVRDAELDGWLAIDPPVGSFDWVESSALGKPDEHHRARIVAPGTTLRSGHPDARMPGPPRAKLRRGDVVRVLDRPPLTLGQGAAARTWLAVAPRKSEVRYVHSDGIRWLGNPPPEPEPRIPPVTESQATFLQTLTAAVGAVPSDVASVLAAIEAEHRAIVRGPIEQWHLDSVKQRYEAMLRTVNDASAGNAIRARLNVVARQEEAAQAARKIETILERSRRRDRVVAQDVRRLAQARTPLARPYDAQGLLQPSSRKVEGHKVFALIGPEGTATAYLDVPAGLDSGPYLSHIVGVRGTVHYSEPLRARLISVTEIEPLDKTKKK